MQNNNTISIARNKYTDGIHKTILLTGATGFLGSHLANYFASQPGVQIVATRRTSSTLDKINELYREKIKFYNVETCNLETIFTENTIDIVIHTATQYGRNDTTSHEILEANMMFPIRLAELAILHNVKCFINTDSYFNKNHNSYLYLANYSLSKKSLLMWLKYLSKGIRVVNMCLEHLYGENDSNEKFVTGVINRIAIRRVNQVQLTPGMQKRDFVYVADVVSAYQTVINACSTLPVGFTQFEVGTGVAVSVKDFVLAIKELSCSNTTLEFGGVPYREDEIMESIANIEGLFNLGWKPKTLHREGIANILASYRGIE